MSPESMSGAARPVGPGAGGRVDSAESAVVRGRGYPPASCAIPWPARRTVTAMPSDRVVRTTGPEPSLVVYASRGRQALLLAGAVAFVVVGALLANGSDPVRIDVGVLAVVVFGFFAFHIARHVLQRGPALVIDGRGITDSASAAPAGFVSWHQVTGLGTWEHSGQKIVTVRVRDPQAVIASAPPIVRVAMRANLRLSGSPVNIATTALPLTPDQLIAEIAALRPDYTLPE